MMNVKLYLSVGFILLSSAVVFGQDPPEVGQAAPALELQSTEKVTHNLALNPEGPRIVVFFRGAW